MTLNLSLGSQLVCYTAWLTSVFALAEFLRDRHVDGELVRKVIHIGIGNIILLAWMLDMPRLLGIGAAVVFTGVAVLSYRVKILQSLNGVARNSFGTTFYAASIGMLIALFWVPGQYMFAVIGILVMTWGDAIAALVGQNWGQHPYTILGNTKSWEGSLARWAVSTSAIWLVVDGSSAASWTTGLAAAAIAAIATGLEVFSWRGLDNLTVPLASGLLSYWIFYRLAIAF